MSRSKQVKAIDYQTLNEPDVAHQLDEVHQDEVVDEMVDQINEDEVVETKIVFSKLSTKDIFDHFGGEMSRGGVSKTMRALSAEGYTTGQIAKMLNKRYQHVRNVLTQPLTNK